MMFKLAGIEKHVFLGAFIGFVILSESKKLYAEDCTVDAPAPILKASALKKGTHQFVLDRRKPNVAPSGVETAILPSGTSVRIESGGCYHWGETYRFQVPSLKASGCGDALRQAVGLMSEIAATSEAPEPRKEYAQILKKRMTLKQKYVCGDELPVMEDMPDYGTIAVNTKPTATAYEIAVEIRLNP